MGDDAIQVRNIFREFLFPNEKILWSGQPKTAILFTGPDIFLIPFSLLWCGFAIFWETSAIAVIPGDTPVGIDIVFPLFGIPFVAVGLYFVFGRFIYKAQKKKKTYYAVTDKRVLVLNTGRNQTLNEIDIKAATNMSKNVRRDGTGSITFGGQDYGILSFTNDMYANTGMDFFSRSNRVAFYDIENVDQVYKTIQRVKSDIS